MALMRQFALALLFGGLTSSCALTLDFDTERASGAGAGAAGGAGDDGGGGGGAPPALPGWAASLSATPSGAAVRLQSVVTLGDSSWIGGYFIGESLALADPEGTETTLHTGDYALYTFALGLDGAGRLKTFVPIARTPLAEQESETWAGTLLHANGGKLVVASSYRDGKTLFDTGTDSKDFGFNLTLLEIDEAGSVEWASRCSADTFDGEASPNMSARFGGFTTATDGTTLFGTTIERSMAVSCDTLSGPPGAGDCDTGERLAQSGHLWSLAADGACSSVALIETIQDGAPGSPLWLDGLASTTAGEVLLGARLSTGEVTIEPWGVDVGTAMGFGLAGTIAPNGSTTSTNLQTVPDVTSTMLVGPDEFFASSVVNTEGALNLVLGKRGSTPLLMGTEAALHDEAMTSISVEGGAILLTGWMSDGSDLATDVCGEACQGDLPPPSVRSCPSSGDGQGDDGFWLLLEGGTSPGLQALGRATGGCLDQRVVDSLLGADSITLLFEIEGETTIDLLGGEKTLVAPQDSKMGAIVKLPRPVP
jgi:hypothetical protein